MEPKHGMMFVMKLEEYQERFRKELDNVVDFWLTYSHDTLHGGFFNCIGRDGEIYDDLKYVWLQGRQVWMYCRLYRTLERFHKPEILEAAKAEEVTEAQLGTSLEDRSVTFWKPNKQPFKLHQHQITGGTFLRRFARVSGGSDGQWKCAFCLTRDGKPVKIQRTIFSECFYVMAMDELSRVIGDMDMKLEADQMMEQLIYWVQEDSSGLGRPQLPGDIPTNSMAVPMMLLSLVQQLTEGCEPVVVQKYRDLGTWCVQQILQHIQRNGTAVLENVSIDGAELPGCLGRLQNPGHTLEAGWFLLQFSAQEGDKTLQRTAIEKFLELPYQCGWDKDHGGLFYFLDVDRHCPTQLEWSMKLWWPHCEALIAFLMAYRQTKRPEMLERFSQIYEYTINHMHIPSNPLQPGLMYFLTPWKCGLFVFCKGLQKQFPDSNGGEWFGYLTQEGKVALDFKGGPFKGFFHVPRCLYMCECILDDLLASKA